MHLFELPTEVLLTLLDWLSEIEISQFGRISKACNDLAHSPMIWRNRYMKRWSKAVPEVLANESASDVGPISKEITWRDQLIKKYLFMRPFEKYFQLGLIDLQSALTEPDTGNGFKWVSVEAPSKAKYVV